MLPLNGDNENLLSFDLKAVCPLRSRIAIIYSPIFFASAVIYMRLMSRKRSNLINGRTINGVVAFEHRFSAIRFAAKAICHIFND